MNEAERIELIRRWSEINEWNFRLNLFVTVLLILMAILLVVAVLFVWWGRRPINDIVKNTLELNKSNKELSETIADQVEYNRLLLTRSARLEENTVNKMEDTKRATEDTKRTVEDAKI